MRAAWQRRQHRDAAERVGPGGSGAALPAAAGATLEEFAFARAYTGLVKPR